MYISVLSEYLVISDWLMHASLKNELDQYHMDKTTEGSQKNTDITQEENINGTRGEFYYLHSMYSDDSNKV